MKLTKYFFQHEEQYKIILQGVQGDSNTKKLASQFIARFFAKFPTLGNAALDAILDLCEDEDIDIRKQAIKDLPILCRDMKEFLPKIADVLSQLLQTEDKSEIVVVQNSLMSLFRRDAKGIFTFYNFRKKIYFVLGYFFKVQDFYRYTHWSLFPSTEWRRYCARSSAEIFAHENQV